MPAGGWKEVALRTWREAGKDNVGLVAAGVAFYGFLALVPLMGAVVLSYGLLADPSTVVHNMRGLTSMMPADAAKLVGEQLMNVVRTSGTKKGFGLLLALAIALFGARNGAGAIMTALNIAYEEDEKRGFLKLNLTALAITAGGVAVAILAVVAIAALGHLEKLLPSASLVSLVAGKTLSYLLLLLGGAGGAATLYRYAPSRAAPRWIWLTPGSVLAALLWLALTLGFGFYVADFGSYNATYGSLGAVVVLLTWLYLSSYVLLFGAELNSECEHQTEADSTTGAPAPLGSRGAWVADRVAGGEEHSARYPAPSIAERNRRPKRDVAPARRGSLPAEWCAARAGNRIARLLGSAGAGLVTSALGTVGLAFLRGRTTRASGAALLATAAIIATLAGSSEDTKSDVE